MMKRLIALLLAASLSFTQAQASVPSVITDMSTSAASNSPAGSDSIGTSLDDYLRAHAAFIAQLFASASLDGGTVGGTANAITLTPSPAITAYDATKLIHFKAASTNTSSTVTVAVSGFAPKAITRIGGAALEVGDIVSNADVAIKYDGTQYQVLSTYGPAPVRGVSIQNGGDSNSSASGSGTDYPHSLTYSVPANFLSSGRALRVTACFKITTGSASPTLVHKLKLGGTTVSSHAVSTPANNLSNDNYCLQWMLSAQAAPGGSVNTTTAMLGSSNGPANSINLNTTDQPVALATNGALTLAVATLWATAGTGTNTIALDQLIVEALR